MNRYKLWGLRWRHDVELSCSGSNREDYIATRPLRNRNICDRSQSQRFAVRSKTLRSIFTDMVPHVPTVAFEHAVCELFHAYWNKPSRLAPFYAAFQPTPGRRARAASKGRWPFRGRRGYYYCQRVGVFLPSFLLADLDSVGRRCATRLHKLGPRYAVQLRTNADDNGRID